MIISASRRTDIPAFYSDWLLNRIKMGFVYVRNPMNPHQLSKVKIQPDVVDCIVFWTKNPSRLLDRIDELHDYSYYFQFTLTGYGLKIEPHVPTIECAINNFRRSAQLLGPKRVIWRYDPILISKDHDIDYHIKIFTYIAERLCGYTNKCVISFVDEYKKIQKQLSQISYKKMDVNTMLCISENILRIGEKYNIKVASCAEEIDLSKLGIEHGKCIDDKLISEIIDYPIEVSKDQNQRTECGCIASVDIGAYNTCLHGCVYCYANSSQNLIRNNYSHHNPVSPLLFGDVSENDKITEKKVYSCKLIQNGLFK